MLETRAFPMQQRYKLLQTKSAALRDKYNALRLESPVLAGEISRLEAKTDKLDEKIAELKEANKILADDLRQSSASAIFARSEEPMERNATAIRLIVADKIAAVETEWDAAVAEIDRLGDLVRDLKAVLKKRARVIKELERKEHLTNAEELEAFWIIAENFDVVHVDAHFSRGA